MNNKLFLSKNDKSAEVVQGKFLTLVDCENLISYCQNYPVEQALVGETQQSNDRIRKSSIRWIPYNAESEKLLELIRNAVIKINRDYWNLELAGYTEPLQFTHYPAGNGHYKWHMDSGNGKLSLRKLSVVIQLSDPSTYEGGELQVQTEGRVIADKEQGNVIFFPSYMQHRVTPVTSGERYSLVLWISGPPYR
jgi:PKHD-type hydroxylase